MMIAMQIKNRLDQNLHDNTTTKLIDAILNITEFYLNNKLSKTALRQ